VVHTKNGDFMKMEAGKNGVAVTPVSVVLPSGDIKIGYVNRENNLTYMAGGSRVPDGAAVVTANGNYYKNENYSAGVLLPSTFTQTLATGSSGADVLALQVELNLRDNAGLALSGKFDGLTQAVVIAHQTANGLKVDGRVGPQTSAALGFGYVVPKNTGTVIGAVQNTVQVTYADTHMAALAFKELYYQRSLDEQQEYFAFVDKTPAGRYILTGVTNSAEALGKDATDLTEIERNSVGFLNDGSHEAKIHTHWSPTGSLTFTYQDYGYIEERYMRMYLVNRNGAVLYSSPYKNDGPVQVNPKYSNPVDISGLNDNFNRHQ
jgi:peptidoglycan hydrolase-like protein with peptidoglycan-binding domain